jgi:hypothetical protein
MKIAILGLGCSLSEFNPTEFDLSIGVNDIWRVVKSNDIVCLNPAKDFVFDRLKVIQESRPEHFWSQIVNWDVMPNFRKIDILPGYGADIYVSLDTPEYYKSFCSPFVACQIGFKEYHANELHLFGVDMIAHPMLNGELCGKIRTHFINLKAALTLKGCGFVVHGQGILANI